MCTLQGKLHREVVFKVRYAHPVYTYVCVCMYIMHYNFIYKDLFMYNSALCMD